ncbi:SHOCT domain-containing protein [Lysinibacillus sp. NPDC093712]|uniref:SHOCT domain-containing protein n=1 Tax=Lysinibacillus sp. NPDC093712 TaxID=3390579 RepID=UPI003CFED28B
MYAIDQIKEYLKPNGWMTLTNLKKEIGLIAEHINVDEIIESAGVAVRGKIALKEYLVVLTSERLITTDKQKKLIAHNYEEITQQIAIKKFNTVEIQFQFNKEVIELSIAQNDTGKVFTQAIQDKLGILPEIQMDSEERKVVQVMKPIKTTIDILNGKEQLKDKGSIFKLSQNKQGEVEISVDYHNTPEVFRLIKWERVENIQKSAFDIAGWSLIGSTFGNAGAIAGAMGANIGKDKSVATLYLKRLNGEKVALVIKCDKKVLEKLSMLIVAEGEEVVAQTVTEVQPSVADEIIKFKQLLDEGILTQDEFDAKKKQLLGI